MDVELDFPAPPAVADGRDHSAESSAFARGLEWCRTPSVLRVVKYAIGSVVSSAVSLVTFVIVYGALGALSPRQSSIVASLAGMVPNYFLNRNWAWGRRGRSHWAKEVLPYVAASVLGLFAAMWSVDFASSHVDAVTSDGLLRVVLVAGAYVGAYLVLWVGKFLFFNVLFTQRTSDRLRPSVGAEPGRSG